MLDPNYSYVLISALSSAEDQQVLGVSGEAGARIQLQRRHKKGAVGGDSASYMWKIAPDDTAGVFKIVKVPPLSTATDGTEQVLDVWGASKEEHGIIQLYPDHRGLNQRWILRLVDASAPMGLGFAFVIISLNSGMAIDVPNASIDEGQQALQQYRLHEAPPKNQQWILDAAVFSLEG